MSEEQKQPTAQATEEELTKRCNDFLSAFPIVYEADRQAVELVANLARAIRDLRAQLAAAKADAERMREAMKSPQFAIVYHDDGPSGVCGQSMDITCPHTYVWLFASPNDGEKWLHDRESIGRNGRRSNARRVYASGSYASQLIDLRAAALAVPAAEREEHRDER